MLHVAPAARTPADKLNEAEPDVAPATVPPQLLVKPGAAATTTPAGSVSTNPTPVMPETFGLVIESISVEAPLITWSVDGVNALVMEGGATTARVAEAVFPLPPSREV